VHIRVGPVNGTDIDRRQAVGLVEQLTDSRFAGLLWRRDLGGYRLPVHRDHASADGGSPFLGVLYENTGGAIKAHSATDFTLPRNGFLTGVANTAIARLQRHRHGRRHAQPAARANRVRLQRAASRAAPRGLSHE
jgi:hypothetical protein